MRVGEQRNILHHYLIKAWSPLASSEAMGLSLPIMLPAPRTSSPKRQVSGNKRGVGIKPTRLSRYIGYTPGREVLIKASTTLNMELICTSFNTLLTSQPPMFWLNAPALRNMALKRDTLLTSQEPMS